MDASQILDALSTSFFGLLAIWAAVARGHWFLRLAVVGGMLLGALWIPAYEVVVEFGIEMALIMLGVWWVRGRKQWQPRLSMETALLAMVVAAVSSAVAARLPDWRLDEWLFLLSVGSGTALVGLLCLWVVFGKARLRRRLFGLAVGLALFVVLFHLGGAVQYAIRFRDQIDWRVALQRYYEADYLRGWFARMIPSTLLSMGIILSMLVLGRASRWFSGGRVDERPSRWPNLAPSGGGAIVLPPAVWAARLALVAIMLLVTSPLVYIFYRLKTPTELPLVELPEPNGYDDFVAAGLMVPSRSQQLVLSLSTTDAQLESELALVQPALDRIALGLTRECYANPASRADQPSSGADETTDDERVAIDAAEQALLIRSMYLMRKGTIEQRIEGSLDLMRFAHERFRGDGCDFNGAPIWWAFDEFRAMLPKLDAAQSRMMARQLLQIDATREPWESIERALRSREEHRSWERHLNLVLDELGGNDPFHDEWEFRRQIIANFRGAIVKLALRAYLLDHGHPPEELTELVPEYLPTLPDNPFGSGKVRYKREGDKVVVYSFGPDGDDDGGEPYAAVNANGGVDLSDGDQTLIIPLSELGAAQPPDETASE